MWEDPRNVEGGRWLLNLQRQQRYVNSLSVSACVCLSLSSLLSTHYLRSCGELDKYWQEALMCLIGEIIEPNSDEV